jgi:hypothetical protein
MRLLRDARKYLRNNPFKSQVAIGGSLWFAGDLISQRISKKADASYDWKRAAIMTFYGTAIASPIYFLWYKHLDKFVYRHFANRSLRSWINRTPLPAKPVANSMWEIVGIKVFLDCFIFDPPTLVNIIDLMAGIILLYASSLGITRISILQHRSV